MVSRLLENPRSYWLLEIRAQQKGFVKETPALEIFSFLISATGDQRRPRSGVSGANSPVKTGSGLTIIPTNALCDVVDCVFVDKIHPHRWPP